LSTATQDEQMIVAVRSPKNINFSFFDFFAQRCIEKVEAEDLYNGLSQVTHFWTACNSADSWRLTEVSLLQG
jgi:hypothetical protein